MSTEKKIMVVALICVSAVLIATGGSIVAGNAAIPVERPFRIHSEATVLIDWENQSINAYGRPIVPWTMTASQVSTEGWSENQGEGVIYLDTFVGEGSGVCTDLNGGTITWDSSEVFGTQHTVVTFTGGTGQYENASGEFTLDYTILTSEVNEDGNPAKITYTFWGAGSITKMI
ncbi:MAG: hypothetical protein A2Z38_00265 [Planctomycetes bacterium RBG_19FT_COMBO_48_8]|nr:MAG: hypothetical protein A2Z38_00265 [Planctomycetes bacterium RBG_19FT_COMBO_48_8]